MSAPPFTLDKPRYDQGTWAGRTLHFFSVTNPAFLLASSDQLKADREALERFKKEGSRGPEDDASLWHSRTRLDAVMHPDTGEPIHPAFRVCAFVPANIPICAGMLMSPPTTANIILWQFANQSYNAGFNFANRNASSPITTTQLGTAFVAATSGAIGIAMGLNKAVSSAKNLSPTLKMVLTRCTPFVAVGLSNVVNLLAMRSGELSTGIPVVDEFDNVLGKSKEAAKSALTQGAVTRAVLPAPVLVLPPLIISQVEKVAPNVVKNPRMKAAMELGIIVGCVWGALPVAIGLFPQKSSISTSKLEKEFQGLKSADGKPITQVYFNKGV